MQDDAGQGLRHGSKGLNSRSGVWAKGPPQASPGHRPGKTSRMTSRALKGRHKTANIPCAALSGLAHSIDSDPGRRSFLACPWASLRQAVGLKRRGASITAGAR
jgi:hypothetical protein